MTDFVYPMSSCEESSDFDVDVIKFGDGYTQRVPNGINNGLRKWSITVNDLIQSDSDAVLAFFRTKAGATSFSWRPQGFAADVRVVCTGYSKPTNNGWKGGSFVYSIRASFEETPI